MEYRYLHVLRKVFAAAGLIGIGIVGIGASAHARVPEASQARAACASMQDFIDDIRTGSSVNTARADLRAAGKAANRSGNADLATQVAKTRLGYERFLVSGKVTTAHLGKSCSKVGYKLR